MALPNIIRRRSPQPGFGVFALAPITKNTRIIRVNRTWSRDAASGGNIAGFINHACRPNCWFDIVDTTIWIRASKSIRVGEELTYDYATSARHHPLPLAPGLPQPAVTRGEIRGQFRG